MKANFEQKHLLSTVIFVLIDSVTIHYLENRRSNLMNFLFISLIRSTEMLCKRISLSCVNVY